MTKSELKLFLDEKSNYYECRAFLDADPIQIPHQYCLKEDIEISAFMTATIAWGNRKSIINSAQKMMQMMDHSPHDFVLNHQDRDLDRLDSFVHRTFNTIDFKVFVTSLKRLYNENGGLEIVFSKAFQQYPNQQALSIFKAVFLAENLSSRSAKHVADPCRGSAAKRINMFLRWMVRPAKAGVDFGLWKSISPSILSCPLDVHSGNVARKLGLLKRKQNDAKAVLELDLQLRTLDANDPVKYDFALFGLGVFEGF